MYGPAIKLIRKYHKLTQVQLGREIGMLAPNLSGLECGHKPVQLQHLELLADYIGVPLSQVIALAEYLAERPTTLDDPKLNAILDWAEENARA